MSPQRIQLRRAKGWRLPEGAVRVDRATRWGNPFVAGVDGTQAECVEHHARLMAGFLAFTRTKKTDPGLTHTDRQQAALDHARAHLEELRGRDLACWCRPGTPCHADTLIALANRAPGEPLPEVVRAAVAKLTPVFLAEEAE